MSRRVICLALSALALLFLLAACAAPPTESISEVPLPKPATIDDRLPMDIMQERMVNRYVRDIMTHPELGPVYIGHSYGGDSFSMYFDLSMEKDTLRFFTEKERAYSLALRAGDLILGRPQFDDQWEVILVGFGDVGHYVLEKDMIIEGYDGPHFDFAPEDLIEEKIGFTAAEVEEHKKQLGLDVSE